MTDDLETLFTAETLGHPRYYSGSPVPNAGESRSTFLPGYRETRVEGGKKSNEKRWGEKC